MKTTWQTYRLKLWNSYFNNICYALPLILGLCACGRGKTADDLNSSSGDLSLLSSSPYEQQALQILTSNCGSCHGSSSGPMGIYALNNVSHLVSSGLIVPGQPDQSPLLQSIEAGRMPPSGALSTQDKSIIRMWIASGASGGGNPTPASPLTPANPPTPTVGSLEEKAIIVLQNNCYACHGGNQSSGGLANITDPSSLIASGWVIPGNATASKIYDAISKSRMPVSGPLNSADIGIIADWINQGAKTPGTSLPPPVQIPLTASFQAINVNIITPKCVSCHSASKASGGVRLDSYNLVLKYLKPGNASSSKLFEIVNSGEMPPRPNPSLSSEELQVFAEWINKGAANN